MGDCMTRKEKFYLDAQRCFDEEILKEIYTTDVVSLCNVGNAYYAAFLLSEENKSQYIQFMLVNDDQIEMIMQDDNNLSVLYHDRPENQKMLYIFDDRAYMTMKNSRDRVLLEGPKIDLDKEKELIEKYSSTKKL